MGAACLQHFLLLKDEGAVRSQGWKTKLLPILSSLTLSASDGKDPLAPTQSLHSCCRPHGHTTAMHTLLTGVHRHLRQVAKQSSTKAPLLALFGSISSTAAWARSQLSQGSCKNRMCFTPCAHVPREVTASQSHTALPHPSCVTFQRNNWCRQPHPGSGGRVQSPCGPGEIETYSCSTQPR